MSTNPSTTDQSLEVRQRAALRTMVRRRRRTILNVLAFVIATAVMVLLSLAQRDSQTVRRQAEFVDEIASVLNTKYAERFPPPTMPQLPDLEGDAWESWRYQYCYVPRNAYAATAEQPRAICYREHEVGLFLRPDGRHVIFFDGMRYEAQWVPEAKVAEMAKPWGIVLSPK